MKDRPLVSVTEILDDETGLYAGDICDFSIHGCVYQFIATYGEKGRADLVENLRYLANACEKGDGGFPPLGYMKEVPK